MNKHDRGYLEGIIDGEGCLCLSKYKAHYKTYTYVPQLTIGNTNKFVLKKIKQLIGEGSLKLCSKDYRHNTKKYYAYRLSSNGLRRLLPKLKLIIKERERKLMLKVLPILKERQYGCGRWHFNYKKKELDNLYKQLKKRKSYGKN